MLAACGAHDASPSDGAGGDARDAGACAHVPGAPATVGTITGIPNTELSGLAASHTIAGLLWTHGDSGGTADIYSIDAATAVARGTLHLAGATNVDWEDIATAPCAAGRCIYVADTGDNDLVRASVAIYEVTEPASEPAGTVDTAAARYDITYPDGPHNVEALFVDPRDGAAYAITKVTTAHASVYAMPRTAGAPAVAAKLGELVIPADDPRVTAADIVVDACGVRLAIRTYQELYELRAGPTASVADVIAGTLARLPVADEDQGEAVAYAADGTAYFTTSEGKHPPLDRVSE